VFADNESALQLYQRSGFAEVARDSMLRRLMGERIRVTMSRQLQLQQQQQQDHGEERMQQEPASS
jgi:hypothetical protein